MSITGPLTVRVGHDVTGYPVFYVCGLSGEQKHDGERLEAMAKLFAAAPELRDALEDALSSFACECGHPACRNCHRTKNAQAALAKAAPAK